jgi:hypothetical protein
VRSEFHARVRKRKRFPRFSIDDFTSRLLFENAATLSLVSLDQRRYSIQHHVIENMMYARVFGEDDILAASLEPFKTK